MRDVVILGSTGSIGIQTVDVIRRNPDRFRVNGTPPWSASGPARPAGAGPGVEVVAVAPAEAAAAVREAVRAAGRPPPRCWPDRTR